MTEPDNALRDIKYQVNSGIAELTINRPDVMNSFRHETVLDLETARERAVADDTVQGILVRSIGDEAFCTGADLDIIADYVEDDSKIKQWLADWDSAFMGLKRADLPVIGCVTGQALAGGLELVLACDIVVSDIDATFGDQHLNVDLVAGGNATQLLPRIVGRRRAKYLILTGDTINAQMALDWGLVNEVSKDSISATRALAQRITAHHPEAVRRAKKLVDSGLDIPLDEGLALERDVAHNHLTSKVAKNGLETFLNR